ncbi:hypothetical protein [Clostridium sp.]|uniref:hypothetical protein n=1 Tax=Clostridium sp. TaxID=1506 RepID=UPI0025BF580D|nr:hypothetical protein [Clostridium sp.]
MKNNSISIFINFLFAVIGIITLALYNSSIEYSIGIFIILIGFIYVQIERIISMDNKSEKRLLLVSRIVLLIVTLILFILALINKYT